MCVRKEFSWPWLPAGNAHQLSLSSASLAAMTCTQSASPHFLRTQVLTYDSPLERIAGAGSHDLDCCALSTLRVRLGYTFVCAVSVGAHWPKQVHHACSGVSSCAEAPVHISQTRPRSSSALHWSAAFSAAAAALPRAAAHLIQNAAAKLRIDRCSAL